MLNTQYVTLSMIPSGVMPVLYCSQYDVGRPLGFVVNNGSEVVNLDQYMVAIEGTRSDGTGIVADVTTDGNIGVFLTTATMTNKSDIYDMQLVIRSTDTHRVASIPFMINVRTAALDENSSVIEEDRSLFQQYTETVMIALAEIRSDIDDEATARINADTTLLEKINIEAADRAAEDNTLNARIDNIIAPGGAPSAAEVTDARLGADGVLYDTLGDAIRTQFEDVYKNLAYTVNLESDITGLLVVNGGIGGTVPTALTATLEPQQSGAGAPSADNIRPFIMFTSLGMLHAGESGGGGSGNPPITPFFGGTQNCITGEWTLYQYNTNYSGVTDMTGVRWWSDRDVYVARTNPSVGAYVVYEPTTPMRESGQPWGAEAMYPGINQYLMTAYDSVTQTRVPFTLNIEADVANVGGVIDGIEHDVTTLQSDMDQTNQALTLLRNEYDITASTVVTHTTLIAENTADIAENTADIAENAAEISALKSQIEALEDLPDRVHQLERVVYDKRYGVSGIGQSASALTRLWDSVGMTAEVGTDGDNSAVVNDFDHAAPFMRRKCVGEWSLANGHAVFTVNAYYGDSDYAEDGTKGDYVAVECPLSYYYFSDGVLGVSSYKHPGFRPFDIFCRNHNEDDLMEYYYLPAYALAEKDGKAVSLPNLDNFQGSYKQCLDAARTYKNGAVGNLAVIQPAAVNFYEWALATVEFAQQDHQKVMNGCCNLRHNGDDRVTFTDATHVLTSNYQAGRVAGEYILITATSTDINIVSQQASHKIVSIIRCDENGNEDASGTHQLIEVDDLGKAYVTYDTTGLTEYRIAARPYRTGSCNSVSTPSGSPVSNSDGYHPMKYRWRENVYANQYKTIVDLFNKRVGTGDSDWILEHYYLPNPENYAPANNNKPDATDLATDDFVKLDVETAHANYVNGYIKTRVQSALYPDIWIPGETTGGSGTTYFADYASLVNSTAVRSVRLGGSWYHGANDGFSYFLGLNAPSNGSAYSGGDLCFIQTGNGR